LLPFLLLSFDLRGSLALLLRLPRRLLLRCEYSVRLPLVLSFGFFRGFGFGSGFGLDSPRLKCFLFNFLLLDALLLSLPSAPIG